MTSITVMPGQAPALAELLADTNGVACDITQAEHWSLRVVTYHAPDQRDPSLPPAEARLWTISCAGTVREHSPTPASA